MNNYSAIQLKERLDDSSPKPFLLDVREPWECQICVINDSQMIPMGKISNSFNTLDPDQEMVVICHHGIRSRSVALFLEQQGFSNVINLTGGIESWARDVDLDMATY